MQEAQPRVAARPASDVAAELALAHRLSAVEANLATAIFHAEESRTALRAIVASRTWSVGSLEQRTQIVRVLEALPTISGDRALLSLGHGSPFQTPTESFAALAVTDRLFQRSADGTTLLSQLDRFTTHALAPAAARCFAGEPASLALSALVQETADPARIDQDNVSTCSVTSLCYELVRRDPAEYARLCAGLLLAGEVVTRGGERLIFDANGTAPTVHRDKPPARTMTERALQSALMQAAYPEIDYTHDAASTARDGPEGYNAKVMTFLPLWAQILAWIVFPVGIALSLIPRRVFGMYDADIARLATSVFGRRYRALDSTLQNLRSHLDAEGRVTAPVFVKFDDFASGAHFLSVVGVEGEGADATLICRNPWGSFWMDLDGSALEPTYADIWQPLPAARRPPAQSLAGLSFVSSREGTIRIPLSSATGRSLSSFIVPLR